MEKLKFLNRQDIFRLKEKYDTPVFIYSKERIINQLNDIKDNFVSPYGHSIRYSLKGNSNISIIALISSQGCQFDAASEWEAYKALAAGVPPEKILITSQEFPRNLDDLIQQGVKLNITSLRFMKMFGERYPGSEISIRINPGKGTGGGKRLTTGGIDSSFGIWFEDITQVLEIAQKYKLKITLLHQHIGSGHNPEDWVNISIEDFIPLLKNFPEVTRINLGGGYRVPVFENDIEFDYNKLTSQLSTHLEIFCIENNRKIHVEYEPCTYVMANSGSLIASIIDVQKNGDNGMNMIKLDTGLTELMRPGFYGALHPLVLIPKDENRIDDNTSDEYLVYGHCCILGDCFTVSPGNPDVLKPMELQKAEPDDLMIVERAGGYSSGMNMKNFNSFPEVPEVLIDEEGNDFLIKKRQTINQIMQNEILVNEILNPVNQTIS